MTTLIEKAKPGELLKEEFAAEYNRESGTIENEGAALASGVSAPLGQPVKLVSTQYRFCAAADIANASGIFIDNNPVEALTAQGQAGDTSTTQHTYLTRGPAVVLSDQLPATDAHGAAIDAAAFAARLLALGIVVRSAPTKTSEQTT